MTKSVEGLIERLRMPLNNHGLSAILLVEKQRTEAADELTRLSRELEETRTELDAAKNFGGGWFAETVPEPVRRHYRSAARARLSMKEGE